jgi:lysophospholipase L1-like esterase
MAGDLTSSRFLALGDSYTVGEGVAEDERWPVQLAAMLRARGAQTDEPLIVAKTGWTTDELIQGIDNATPEGTFALVSLLIGVNNQYRGRTVDEYRTQFAELLRRAIAFAGGKADHVIVLSIPDWGATPFAAGRNRLKIGREIDAFNAVNLDEALRAGAHYVDVTPSSRLALSDASLVASDGLHPSGKMYRVWAEAVLVAASAALGTRTG